MKRLIAWIGHKLWLFGKGNPTYYEFSVGSTDDEVAKAFAVMRFLIEEEPTGRGIPIAKNLIGTALRLEFIQAMRKWATIHNRTH